MELINELNNTEYTFLNTLEEPIDNWLILIIDVGIVATYEEETIAGKARPVLTDEHYPQYEISFSKGYVSYQVSNESFVSSNGYDEYIGRIVKTYSKSLYLEYVLSTSIADNIFPGELKHYGIFCQNHIIDVISLGEVVIKRLR